MDETPLVLLVDDDDNDEELARVALRRAGIAHRLEVVRDGAEALDWLFGRGAFAGRDVGRAPRLILLDLKLPKVNGLEVVAAVRRDERTRLLPIVVFTSSNEEHDLRESYRLGANAYVRKPVDFDAYKRLIADVGTFWILHNEPALDRRDGASA